MAEEMKKKKEEGATKTAPKGVRPTTAERIAGDAKMMRKLYNPFLPSELVAGSIPHIAGSEEESVWNAAVQACGTERVHFSYTIEGGKCWYIATPSSALASNPDSWCPLVAALPGNGEHWDKETVYLFEEDGHAAALRWDKESGRMQLFLGASRTILPKIQSMDANFVTVNSEMADICPWTNRELKIDLLTRAVGKMMVVSGVVTAALATLYILLMLASSSLIQPQLDETKTETEAAAMQLLRSASESLENDSIKHIFRIQELLDNLQQIEGTLLRYEVKEGGIVEWEALVPRTFSSGSNRVLKGAKPVGNKLEADGRVRIRGSR
ncbi:MAG: hypothetical protein COB76_04745 [Alphaproteobacteria bacterium]|nr:MAG: hypothetical protein COB76_04745 [Alphaproteobacteria bacterium]